MHCVHMYPLVVCTEWIELRDGSGNAVVAAEVTVEDKHLVVSLTIHHPIGNGKCARRKARYKSCATDALQMAPELPREWRPAAGFLNRLVPVREMDPGPASIVVPEVD